MGFQADSSPHSTSPPSELGALDGCEIGGSFRQLPTTNNQAESLPAGVLAPNNDQRPLIKQLYGSPIYLDTRSYCHDLLGRAWLPMTPLAATASRQRQTGQPAQHPQLGRTPVRDTNSIIE